MKTNYIHPKEYKEQIATVIKDLSSTYSKSEILLNEQLYPIDKDSYHFIARLLKSGSDERIKRSICSLLFKDVYRAEILSGGGGEIAFIFAMDFAAKLLSSDIDLSNQTRVQKQLDAGLAKLKNFVESSSEPMTETEFKRSLVQSAQDETIATICHEAIKLAGFEGKIFVENSKQSNYSIEMKEGYSFDLQPYNFFLENNSWERKECKVLVVDGFVEAISEIDQLLMKAHDYKQPMAIIAHGFSEEVVATLVTNKNRGALDVSPIRVKPDLNSLNLINDIGIVCGQDPISSLKGQLLTFCRWEDLPTIDKIIVTQNKTSIENQKTTNAVLSQVNMLLEKRIDNQLVEDVQEILENRIKNLSSNSVTIYLPNMNSIQNDATRVKIDVTLRQAKTLLNYGNFLEWLFYDEINYNPVVVGMEDYKDKIPAAENDIENCLFKTLSTMSLGNKQYSPLSYYVGILLANKTIMMLICSGGFVGLEDLEPEDHDAD